MSNLYNIMSNIYNISKHVTFAQLAKHFHLEPSQLNNILINLSWVENPYTPTKLGKKNGAMVHTYTYSKIKFIYWRKKILSNKILKESVEKYIADEKAINNYRAVIENYYKRQGYTLSNFNKGNTCNNQNIHYIAKKNREIILMNSPYNPNDITLDDIKKFELKKDEFIDSNPIFLHYDIKLQYTLSSFALSESAFSYLKENSHAINYQIIK